MKFCSERGCVCVAYDIDIKILGRDKLGGGGAWGL